jgi:ApaG protein
MRYEQSSHGIRVSVRPRFSLADSEPAEGTFVFAYTISMANESDSVAQLLFRHWRIHDAAGDDSTVGEQPILAPGETHEYQSYCVLRSPVGYMEGHYTFVGQDGEHFRVEVPRFHLNGPLVLPQAGPGPFEDDEPTDVLH